MTTSVLQILHGHEGEWRIAVDSTGDKWLMSPKGELVAVFVEGHDSTEFVEELIWTLDSFLGSAE